jgi:single-strand DNA-binding protein
MAATLNKVMLIGNLGADPEVRRFEDGNALARISLATSETYTNREGQKVTQTEWHMVVFRRGLADVIEKYVKKGDKLYVEGKIKTRKWEENGQPRYSTEIHADNMTMLTPKDPNIKDTQSYEENAAETNKSNTFAKEPAPPEDPGDDDLPF